MNKVLKMTFGLTIACAMSGCVYAGPPNQPAYVQGGVAYDGYYDGHYGAYSGGYWNNDGYFYYRGSDNNYRRDDQRHFRREQFHGGSGFSADRRDQTHYDHNSRDDNHGRNRSGQGGSNRYEH